MGNRPPARAPCHANLCRAGAPGAGRQNVPRRPGWNRAGSAASDLRKRPAHRPPPGEPALDALRHQRAGRDGCQPSLGDGPRIGAPARMECNLLPPDNFETVEKWLVDLASSRARASVAGAIAERIPERVARAIVIHAGIDPAVVCGQLSRQARRQLVGALTSLPLPILRHRGWNYAEVTAGGVPLDEISYRTMESRKVPGLYLAGEMLDCDGRIGGFNFQWAWATGHLAGKAAGAA